MSSTEPGFSAGDGLSAARDSTDALPVGANPPPLPVMPRTASNTTPSDVGLGLGPDDMGLADRVNDRDGLPPLVSLSDMVIEAPPWLLSAVLHMIAVIVLGLLFVVPERAEEILLQFDYHDDLGEDFSGNDLDLPLDFASQDIETAMTAQEVPQFEETLVTPPTVIKSPIVSQPVVEPIATIRQALSGREKGMQHALLSAYGGTGATQQAVLEALKWLARNQERHGLWSLSGKYSDGARRENQLAATAMALLAFQGAGYTSQGDHLEPFTKVVRRGWRSLLEKEDENGRFFDGGRSHDQLYTQAMCTIALCELYGMTGASQYHEPAQQAIDYCVKIQTPEGGWRYFPGQGNDLSVTGWFVMALQSAKMAGLEVPSPTFDRVSGYIDSVARDGGSQYAYQGTQSARLAMTAEGLLCRQYLGWSRSNRRLHRGVDILLENPPTWKGGERNVYYWYYATQVCHHMEGKHWRAWNRVMREEIPQHQVRDGKERGSWDPRGDEWGAEGGRLFVTCLSTYMLEVYYRHLPIYQHHLLDGL